MYGKSQADLGDEVVVEEDIGGGGDSDEEGRSGEEENGAEIGFDCWSRGRDLNGFEGQSLSWDQLLLPLLLRRVSTPSPYHCLLHNSPILVLVMHSLIHNSSDSLVRVASLQVGVGAAREPLDQLIRHALVLNAKRALSSNLGSHCSHCPPAFPLVRSSQCFWGRNTLPSCRETE